MSAVNYNSLSLSGDSLDNLPIDQSEPTRQEIEIVDTLFKKHRSTMSIVVDEMKNSFLVGALFLVLSLPQVDALIQRMIPLTNSIYFLLIVKLLLFVALYWLLKHFYLCRNPKK